MTLATKSSTLLLISAVLTNWNIAFSYLNSTQVLNPSNQESNKLPPESYSLNIAEEIEDKEPFPATTLNSPFAKTELFVSKYL